VRADVSRPRDICQRLVEFAYGTDARLVVTPMQDLLALDERFRMNMPGTVGFNWKWCLKPDYLLEVDAVRLRELCESNGRLN